MPTDVQILTIPFEPGAQAFDEDILRRRLLHREIIRTDAAFFVVDGKPFWSVCVVSRPLNPRPRPRAEEPPRKIDQPEPPPLEDKKALRQTLKALDERQRACYERLRAWRRVTADKAATPPYVVLTNQQILALVLDPPRTMAALKQMQGFGRKRADLGAQILELLHGPPAAADGDEALRDLDRGHGVALPADTPLPTAPAPLPDEPG